MTKAKKSLITGASVVGLACCMAGSLLCTTGIAASAASDFAANSEGGAVFLNGQPEANILASLTAKVAATTADIQKVLDKDGDLA